MDKTKLLIKKALEQIRRDGSLPRLVYDLQKHGDFTDEELIEVGISKRVIDWVADNYQAFEAPDEDEVLDDPADDPLKY